MSIAAGAIAKWRADPVLFVRDQFGIEPDLWQLAVLEALPHEVRVALKACKGPGKTCLEAWVIWWFLLTRPHPKILCSSITGDNLRDGLWTELAKWRQKSKLLDSVFEQGAERIWAREAPETWWCSSRQWSKDADQGQQANTLAGIHADYVLVVLDEVSDYPDGVVVAAEAALSTGVETRMLVAGNPTRTEGPLWRICTTDRHRWWVKEITGDPDAVDRAPRISVEWARAQIQTWGADNPWVLTNVFGKFPPTASNKLIGPEEVSAACERDRRANEIADFPVVAGVDVARFGDDRSVLFLRQGPVAFRPRVYRNLDTQDLADAVAGFIQERTPDAVFVDQTGVGGGVYDRLARLGYGYCVVGIDFAMSPMDPRFADRRSEMWWKMADWIKHGGCIPDDGSLRSELTAPSYAFDAKSKLRLESKRDLKKRGQPSPDLADGLALTFASPVAPRKRQGQRGGESAVAVEYDPFARSA